MRYRVWISGRPETERIINVRRRSEGRTRDESIRGHAVRTIYFSDSDYELLEFKRIYPK